MMSPMMMTILVLSHVRDLLHPREEGAPKEGLGCLGEEVEAPGGQAGAEGPRRTEITAF